MSTRECLMHLRSEKTNFDAKITDKNELGKRSNLELYKLYKRSTQIIVISSIPAPRIEGVNCLTEFHF
jgi:hypothetical protein